MNKPVYLIQVSRGGTDWRFTNYGESAVANGELWTNENIEIGNVKSGFDFLTESLELTIGTDRKDHPLRYYVANPRALERTNVKIYKINAGDATFDEGAPFYSGIVGANQPGRDGTIKIVCSSMFRIGEVPLPRPKVQRMCNLRLGDVNCTINLLSFTTTGAVTGLQADDPPFVEASEFGAKATAQDDANWFALGTVKIGSEERVCIGQNGNRLYLDAQFNFATIGQAAAAVAGCDKRINTCLNKFNNVENFLGFPYAPNQTTYQAALTLSAKNVAGKK